MKNILQIPAHLFPGGVEKVARDIGLFATPNEYHVDYIVFDDFEGEYEPQLKKLGCRVFHLGEPSHDYRKFISDLKQIMSETKYDIVHAHTMFNIGWIMLVAKQMGVPVRVSHAHSALDNNGGMKVKLYESVMRKLILANATDLIACGEKAGIRLYGEKAYKERGKLILNGIDTRKFAFNVDNRVKMRAKLGVEDRFVIGHAGHLAEVKNQKFLVELMPDILKKKENAVLLLLGGGPDRQMLEGLVAELGISDKVIMTGAVSNVEEYLSAMDIFAFPSLYEGMPLSIIEAQANGLPCILSTGVPKDVYLTELVVPIELSDRETWIKSFLKAERNEPEKYSELLREKGFDTETSITKIYSVYENRL